MPVNVISLPAAPTPEVYARLTNYEDLAYLSAFLTSKPTCLHVLDSDTLS